MAVHSHTKLDILFIIINILLFKKKSCIYWMTVI